MTDKAFLTHQRLAELLRQVDTVHQLAVDVLNVVTGSLAERRDSAYQLKVISGAVTNPDWLGVLVPGQMVEFQLLEVFTAVDGVYADTSEPLPMRTLTSAEIRPSSG